MSNTHPLLGRLVMTVMLTGLLISATVRGAGPIDFDFDELNERISAYTVFIKVQVELSFGTQTSEHEERVMGTIVSEDGLLIFDGGFLSEENPFISASNFSFRSTPKRIEVITLSEEKYDAEYVGVDRYTGFAFARIVNGDQKFKPVKFVSVPEFVIGSWLAAYVILPEFVDPPVAADIGMVSNLIKAPEYFPLTIGFSSLEFASVLYDVELNPVGILGELKNPTRRASVNGMMDSFGRLELPLLGVITADRLEKLIANPPRRGQVDHSWLGITMQSLTPDIADFLAIEGPGGIIVNKVIPGSPADEAGLLVGDVIYSVNDQQIEVDRDEELAIFQRHISGLGVGSTIELAVVRPIEDRLDSLKLLAILKAAPLAASDAESYEYEAFELTVRNLVFSDFLNYNLGQNALTGVVVSELRPGGLAAIAGLRPADVIQRANDQAILSVDDFSAYLTAVEAEKPAEMVFFVWRFGKTMFVNLKTDWP